MQFLICENLNKLKCTSQVEVYFEQLATNINFSMDIIQKRKCWQQIILHKIIMVCPNSVRIVHLDEIPAFDNKIKYNIDFSCSGSDSDTLDVAAKSWKYTYRKTFLKLAEGSGILERWMLKKLKLGVALDYMQSGTILDLCNTAHRM